MYKSVTDRTSDWSECTLFVPTVSVGNVGQLSVDLIISTLGMERVGYIHHPSLLPVAGNNPFAHEDSNTCQLMTCCEVYESQTAKVVVIQQRAPIVKGRGKQFSDWLTAWIKSQKFHQIVVLTSAFAQLRTDQQMGGSPFRILQSASMKELCGDWFKSHDWTELETRRSFPTPTPLEISASGENQQLVYMPGSGIAKSLFDGLQDQPVLVLMMFVSEGDNAYEAVAMATQVNSWLNILQVKEPESQEVKSKPAAKHFTKWEIPMSWQFVFGSGFDQRLFQ